jgi:CRP/FNR family cyclic AMP-dependent transcriptional regulator
VSALPAPASIRAVGRARRSWRTVALLRVDAGLRAAVPAEELPFAERDVLASRFDLHPGPWSPEMLVADTARPFAALLLDGMVTQEILLGGRCSANLLGPGDVFRPWRAIDTALPCTARWTCAADASIAVLGERFLTAARRWPGLTAVVHERLTEQLELSGLRTAILGLPRVEDRVLAFFWQLADRWGIVRPDGVVIGLALTHALIGQFVGAQRPTVSLALQALAEDRLLRRTSAGVWTLSHDSHQRLASGPRQAVGPGPTVSMPLQDLGVAPARLRAS